MILWEYKIEIKIFFLCGDLFYGLDSKLSMIYYLFTLTLLILMSLNFLYMELVWKLNDEIYYGLFEENMR